MSLTEQSVGTALQEALSHANEAASSCSLALILALKELLYQSASRCQTGRLLQVKI